MTMRELSIKSTWTRFIFTFGMFTSLVSPAYPNTLLPSQKDTYQFFAGEITVEDALETFARNLNIKIHMENKISVTGKYYAPQNVTVEEYINDLTNVAGLVWYYDGIVLRISESESLKYQIIQLQKNPGSYVFNSLKLMNIMQDKFLHSYSENVFLVYGPETYTTMLRDVIQAIDQAGAKQIEIMRSQPANE